MKKLSLNAARLHSSRALFRAVFAFFALAFVFALWAVWQKPESPGAAASPFRRTAQSAPMEVSGGPLSPESGLSCESITREFESYHSLMELSSSAFEKSLSNALAFLEKAQKTKKLNTKDLQKMIQRMNEALAVFYDNRDALWEQSDIMLEYIEKCSGSGG